MSELIPEGKGVVVRMVNGTGAWEDGHTETGVVLIVDDASFRSIARGDLAGAEL